MKITKEPIDGVMTKSLRLIPDERGFLMEMLRTDWPEYAGFAQAYITASYPGIIKAWHYHKIQWDHFVGVGGMTKVVLCDMRPQSPTHGFINEYYLGYLNPILLKIPPMVYHGFTAVGGETALIVNFPTALYNYREPDEYRLPYNDPSLPYDWGVKHG